MSSMLHIKNVKGLLEAADRDCCAFVFGPDFDLRAPNRGQRPDSFLKANGPVEISPLRLPFIDSWLGEHWNLSSFASAFRHSGKPAIFIVSPEVEGSYEFAIDMIEELAGRGNYDNVLGKFLEPHTSRVPFATHLLPKTCAPRRLKAAGRMLAWSRFWAPPHDRLDSVVLSDLSKQYYYDPAGEKSFINACDYLESSEVLDAFNDPDRTRRDFESDGKGLILDVDRNSGRPIAFACEIAGNCAIVLPPGDNGELQETISQLWDEGLRGMKLANELQKRLTGNTQAAVEGEVASSIPVAAGASPNQGAPSGVAAKGRLQVDQKEEDQPAGVNPSDSGLPPVFIVRWEDGDDFTEARAGSLVRFKVEMHHDLIQLAGDEKSSTPLAAALRLALLWACSNSYGRGLEVINMGGGKIKTKIYDGLKEAADIELSGLFHKNGGKAPKNPRNLITGGIETALRIRSCEFKKELERKFKWDDIAKLIMPRWTGRKPKPHPGCGKPVLELARIDLALSPQVKAALKAAMDNPSTWIHKQFNTGPFSFKSGSISFKSGSISFKEAIDSIPESKPEPEPEPEPKTTPP